MSFPVGSFPGDGDGASTPAWVTFLGTDGLVLVSTDEQDLSDTFQVNITKALSRARGWLACRARVTLQRAGIIED